MGEVVPGEAAGSRLLHFRLGAEECRPPLADLETVLGYTAGAPEAVREVIAAVVASCEEAWEIEGGCVVHPSARVEIPTHRLTVAGVEFEVGKIVSGQLARATSAAIFLCTAGPGIGRLSKQWMADGDPLAAFVADTLGSLVVERAMDHVQSRLEAEVGARGLRLTNRYSPGYCGWPVQEQQQLFRLLPAGFCGVSLTDSSLMLPVKSVSGVIGVGADVRRSPYTCRLCDVEDCLYRRLQPAERTSPEYGDARGDGDP